MNLFTFWSREPQLNFFTVHFHETNLHKWHSQIFIFFPFFFLPFSLDNRKRISFSLLIRGCLCPHSSISRSGVVPQWRRWCWRTSLKNIHLILAQRCWSDKLIHQSLVSVMHLADISELRSSNPMEMHVFPSFPCKEGA